MREAARDRAPGAPRRRRALRAGRPRYDIIWYIILYNILTYNMIYYDMIYYVIHYNM